MYVFDWQRGGHCVRRSETWYCLFLEQDPTFPPTFSRPVNLKILKQGDFAF